MTCTIQEIYIGYPHPRLIIETSDEGRWAYLVADDLNERIRTAAGNE